MNSRRFNEGQPLIPDMVLAALQPLSGR